MPDDDVLLEAKEIVLGPPRIAASVSTRVVSWNAAAEMNDWVVGLALVIPCSTGSRLVADPLEGRSMGAHRWTADGTAVLALDWGSGELYRLEVGAERRMTFPFRDAECSSAESFRRGLIVCAVPELVADVWMVTGIDPARQ